MILDRTELDVLVSKLCGCDTEAVLRDHLPLHDGMSERVNAHVTICRDSHEYGGSPAAEEMLTCHGQLVIDGVPHRFVWSVLYRGQFSINSALHVTGAFDRREREHTGPAGAALSWTRRCNG